MNTFDGIALSESYVLGISIEPYMLRFSMEFLLLPEHPHYQPACDGERACFRLGLIEVSRFTAITWLASGFPPGIDATDEIDWGNMEEFSENGSQRQMIGDWGQIDVEGGVLSISFHKMGPE